MANENNIVPSGETFGAQSNRNNHLQVDRDYLTSIGYPTYYPDKFAQMTYQINSVPFTLSGDINLGSVNLLGSDDLTEADVLDLANNNALAIAIVNSTGNQITKLDGNLLNRSTLQYTLSAVEANGNGSGIPVSGYNKYTIHTISTEVTGGATIEIQSSLDGTNYATIATFDVTANETNEIAISDQIYNYLRTTVTDYVDGVYSSIILGGN